MFLIRIRAGVGRDDLDPLQLLVRLQQPPSWVSIGSVPSVHFEIGDPTDGGRMVHRAAELPDRRVRER